MKARFLSFAMAALLCSGLAWAKVNVNTATAEELDTLYGIGETRAQAIIDYRRQNGPFKSLRDLKKVPGLHENVIEGLKGKVSFSGPSRIEAADSAATKASDKKAAPEKAPRAEGAASPAKPMSLPAPTRNAMAPAAPAKPAVAAPAAVAAEKPMTPASPLQPAQPARPMLDHKPAAPAVAPEVEGGPAKPAAPAVPGMPAKPAAPVVKPAGPAIIPAPAAPAKPAGPAKPAVPAASY